MEFSVNNCMSLSNWFLIQDRDDWISLIVLSLFIGFYLCSSASLDIILEYRNGMNINKKNILVFCLCFKIIFFSLYGIIKIRFV